MRKTYNKNEIFYINLINSRKDNYRSIHIFINLAIYFFFLGLLSCKNTQSYKMYSPGNENTNILDSNSNLDNNIRNLNLNKVCMHYYITNDINNFDMNIPGIFRNSNISLLKTDNNKQENLLSEEGYTDSPVNNNGYNPYASFAKLPIPTPIYIDNSAEIDNNTSPIHTSTHNSISTIDISPTNSSLQYKNFENDNFHKTTNPSPQCFGLYPDQSQPKKHTLQLSPEAWWFFNTLKSKKNKLKQKSSILKQSPETWGYPNNLDKTYLRNKYQDYQPFINNVKNQDLENLPQRPEYLEFIKSIKKGVYNNKNRNYIHYRHIQKKLIYQCFASE